MKQMTIPIGTVPKFYRQIIDRGKIDISNTYLRFYLNNIPA
jgi:hypothetical protein